VLISCRQSGKLSQLKIVLSHGVASLLIVAQKQWAAINDWGRQFHGVADSSLRQGQIGPVKGFRDQQLTK
jgi:hypothetical protein